MRLEIPKPCSADWDKMKIGLRSRHCDSCAKNVIDFRGQTKEEVLLYLLQNRHSQTCGRFTKSQLDVIHLEEMITITALRKLPRNKVFAVLAIACLLLASCNNEPVDNAQSTQIVSDTISSSIKPTRIDSTASINTIADTSYVDPGPAPIDPITEIEIGEVEIMGDVPSILPDDSLQVLEPPSKMECSKDAKIYTIAEVMPEFPGGMDSLFSFIRKHLDYPAIGRELEIEGKVYARFVVEEDGSITKAEILRGINGYKSFDNTVLDVIALMPKWVPGKQHGKTVPVYFTLPFSFRLD